MSIICESYIDSILTYDNVLNIYLAVHQFNNLVINKKCCNFLCQQVLSINTIYDFIKSITNVDMVYDIFDNDYICLTDEQIFAFALIIIDAKKYDQKNIDTLMSAIRLPLMDTNFLYTSVKTCQYINSDKYMEALEYKLMPGKFDGSLKKYPQRQHCLFAFGKPSGDYDDYRLVTNNDIENKNFTEKFFNCYKDTNNGFMILEKINDMRHYMHISSNFILVNNNKIIINTHKKNPNLIMIENYENIDKNFNLTVGSKVAGLYPLYIKKNYHF